MAKALRFFLANDNGDLVSPFEAYSKNPDLIQRMRAGEETRVGRNLDSAYKHTAPDGDAYLRMYTDDGITPNTAPHEGASVLIKPDERYSIFNVMPLLGDVSRLELAIKNNRIPSDKMEKAREKLRRMLDALPMQLRRFIQRYGGVSAQLELGRYKRNLNHPSEFYDILTRLKKGGAEAFKGSQMYGYQGLADNMLELLMMLPANNGNEELVENKSPYGQLQLWQVDVPKGGFIPAEEVEDDNVTAFRDFESDVPVRRLTPVQPVERVNLNKFIQAYNNLDYNKPFDEREKELEGAMAEYFKIDPTEVPSDALCKNVYMSLPRRRDRCVLNGVMELGQ